MEQGPKLTGADELRRRAHDLQREIDQVMTAIGSNESYRGALDQLFKAQVTTLAEALNHQRHVQAEPGLDSSSHEKFLLAVQEAEREFEDITRAIRKSVEHRSALQQRLSQLTDQLAAGYTNLGRSEVPPTTDSSPASGQGQTTLDEGQEPLSRHNNHALLIEATAAPELTSATERGLSRPTASAGPAPEPSTESPIRARPGLFGWASEPANLAVGGLVVTSLVLALGLALVAWRATAQAPVSIPVRLEPVLFVPGAATSAPPPIPNPGGSGVGASQPAPSATPQPTSTPAPTPNASSPAAGDLHPDAARDEPDFPIAFEESEDQSVAEESPGRAAVIVAPRGFSGLKLRATPSTSARVLGSLPNGSPVELLEGRARANRFTWVSIRTRDGLEGWAVASGVVPL